MLLGMWAGFGENRSGAKAQICSPSKLVTSQVPIYPRRMRDSPYLQFLNNTIFYLTLDLKLQ